MAVVDVLVTVPDADAEAAFASPLEAAGLVLPVREPGHRRFRTVARDVQVRVYADEAREVVDYLILRERLRRSPEDRELYSATKRRLAAAVGGHERVRRRQERRLPADPRARPCG